MIYLDNAATTPVCKESKEVVIANIDNFYNPSSVYKHGVQIKECIENTRSLIADLINASPDEIYFTSGGSEANTWALKCGISFASNIEHSSIKPNFTFRVEKNGIVNPTIFNEKLNDINIMCPIKVASCMVVNNEIGTIQPIKELCDIAHANGVLFHTDAVQAIGHIKIDVKELGVDMMSASAHKFGGIKGCGFLYIKNGVEIPGLIHGGKQERGLRGGTENVLGILAMGEAFASNYFNIGRDTVSIKHMSDEIKKTMLSIDGVTLNGDEYKRYAGNLNFRIHGVKASDFVSLADQFGICISAGSACHEGDALPSHVLTAIGLNKEEALSSIRISIGKQNTPEEINYVCGMFPKIIKRLRDVRVS